MSWIQSHPDTALGSRSGQGAAPNQTHSDLIRGMAEVATYCDNIVLVRVGTKPMILKNVGQQLAPSAKTLTAFAFASGVVTFSGTNDFSAGDSVVVAGFTDTRS